MNPGAFGPPSGVSWAGIFGRKRVNCAAARRSKPAQDRDRGRERIQRFRKRQELRAILNVQKELYGEGNFDAYELASTYSLLGNKQQALNLLEIAVTNHEQRDVAMRIDQNFLVLHDEPSFREMVARVGLAPLA